jgi:FKBP-type peptidyl-prolyl cis-trans isomerase SlyD
MRIEDGCRVSLHVRLFDAQGNLIEETEEPIVYRHGAGEIFPRIEAMVVGQDAGFKASAWLEPEDAFGDFDAERVHLIAVEELGDSVSVGLRYEGLPGRPDGRSYLVTDLAEGMAVLDGNHPLAGMTLRFDVEIIAVEAAGDAGASIDMPGDILRVFDPHDLHGSGESTRH